MTTPQEVLTIVNDLYRHEKSLSGLIQRLRPKICPFDKLLPYIPDNSTVLDVGCGSGLWAGLMVRTGRATFVHGFDSSKKAIDVAIRMREHLPTDQQEKLHFEYRNVKDGIPDGQFDVVSMIDVLHHIRPKFQEKAIIDVLPHIKQGGLFLYKDMASKPFFCGMMNRLHDLASAKEWIHYFPINQLESIVKIVGGGQYRLILQESTYCRLYWYQHEWRVFRKE
jgi:2-polyprenyl-3-methyl-5-hydroxy-6-metoxy-1,4-benzoquinol methylase